MSARGGATEEEESTRASPSPPPLVSCLSRALGNHLPRPAPPSPQRPPPRSSNPRLVTCPPRTPGPEPDPPHQVEKTKTVGQASPVYDDQFTFKTKQNANDMIMMKIVNTSSPRCVGVFVGVRVGA